MKIIKKIKPIYLIPLTIILLVSAVTLGRFIYLEIKKNFFNTTKFYFNSDKLREKDTLYLINNYNGIDNYDIVINMNSIKNNLEKANTDINYDITYNCSNKARCNISKTEGVIYGTSNTDFFIATISPKVTLKDKDELVMRIEVKAKEPYKKSLFATFKLVVGNYGLSYEISDEAGSNYLEFKMTNTLDYYRVITPFGSHHVGDRIDISTYLSLNDSDKEKCRSATINLEFDPHLILYDNASFFSGIISTQTEVISNYNYVNKVKFKLDAISSKTIRFYKKDKSQNYTYPITNSNPIINVTYE